MKTLIPFILLSLFFNFCSAQNLVSNPSFEEYTLCPSSTFQVENCVGWYSAVNSPDYFNVCALQTVVSVPDNSYGYQNAYVGYGYMGMAAYSTDDYRECIRGTLIQPLIIGQKYYVSFKVSLAEKGRIYACNKLGALFTNLPYSSLTNNPAAISNNPNVYTNTIITDTTNWVTVSGSFVADSAYQYIMIGNFLTIAIQILWLYCHIGMLHQATITLTMYVFLQTLWYALMNLLSKLYL